MPNIMIVGEIPNVNQDDFFIECFRLTKRLRLGDDDAVITTVQQHSYCHENMILMYGFPTENSVNCNELLFKIMDETGMLTFPVPSLCLTAGTKRETSPHLVVVTQIEKVESVVEKLKGMNLDCDMEIHIHGCGSIVSKASYVQVKLLQQEAEQFQGIIKGLLKMGVPRDYIVASIIHDFIPAKISLKKALADFNPGEAGKIFDKAASSSRDEYGE